MALQGDIIRVTPVLNDSNEGLVMNVFWCLVGAGDPADQELMDTVALRLNTMYGYLDNYMPDTVDFYEIRFFNETQKKTMPTQSWPTLTVGGVDVADPMPAPCSALVFGRCQTSRRVGRKFLGPFTEADHADGVWLGGLDTALANFAQYWIASFQCSTNEVLRFVIANAVTLDWDIILEGVVRTVVAYQRRRRAGRGV